MNKQIVFNSWRKFIIKEENNIVLEKIRKAFEKYRIIEENDTIKVEIGSNLFVIFHRSSATPSGRVFGEDIIADIIESQPDGQSKKIFGFNGPIDIAINQIIINLKSYLATRTKTQTNF